MGLLEPNDAFQYIGCASIVNDDRTRKVEINANNELLVTQGSLTGAINGLNETFEDTSFVVGDSPVILDFNAAAGRNALDGYIINDGTGDFTVEFSQDGAVFGGSWTMKQGETMSLRNYDIDSLRITHVADSAYRVNLI
jgi:hypothetical protein